MNKKQVLRIVRFAALAALLVVLGFALARNFHEVSHQISTLSIATLVSCEVAALGALTSTMLAWRALLADLGSKTTVLQAARIFFLGQLGKYVPGSVWPVVMQMELGAAIELPRPAVASASLLGIGVGLGSGAGVALITGPAVLSTTSWWQWLLPPLGALVLAGMCIPGPVSRLVALGLRVTKRAGLTPDFSSRGLATAMSWTSLSWVLYGIQVRLLAGALGSHKSDLWVLSIGALTIAVCAGLIIIFAPAGAGVRETVLVFLLAPALSSDKATALALVSRLLLSVGDLLVALTALVTTRKARQIGHSTLILPGAGENEVTDASTGVET